MKYFLLEQSKDYNGNPEIKEWYGKLDMNSLRRKGMHSNERFMFYINVKEQTFFPDFMMAPTMMVSESLKSVISLYEKHAVFEEIFLLDPDRNEGYQYYLTFLPVVDCFIQTNNIITNKNQWRSRVVNKDVLWNRNIVTADGTDGQCIIVSLDFAESILRKEMTGFNLIELLVQ